jgi:large subunit ribosomal protein L21
VLRITEILTNDNKPTIGPRARREKTVEAAAPVTSEDEAPKAAKKKSTAKKPVAKKAAAKPRAKTETAKAPAKKAAPKGKSEKK